MLVSKNAKICVTPNAKPKIYVTPNANPKLKSVEHRLCWVPNAIFFALAMYFFFVCVDFIRVGSRFSVEYGPKTKITSNHLLVSLKMAAYHDVFFVFKSNDKYH